MKDIRPVPSGKVRYGGGGGLKIDTLNKVIFDMGQCQ